MYRNMNPIIFFIAVVISLCVRSPLEAAQRKPPSGGAGKVAAETWALSAREGGCAPVSILERKGPEFRDFQTPFELVEKLKAAKIKAELKEYNVGNRQLVEVRVPDRGVYVMFVPANTCAKFLDKKQ